MQLNRNDFVHISQLFAATELLHQIDAIVARSGHKTDKVASLMQQLLNELDNEVNKVATEMKERDKQNASVECSSGNEENSGTSGGDVDGSSIHS